MYISMYGLSLTLVFMVSSISFWYNLSLDKLVNANIFSFFNYLKGARRMWIDESLFVLSTFSCWNVNLLSFIFNYIAS